jgi:hypothetical protein
MKSISKSIMIFAMAAIVYSAAMAGEINQAKNDEQSVVTAVINRTITYQGLLKNSSGTPVPNNTYNITFKVYKQPSGGSALWTSALTPVATSSGLFSTPVGPISLPFDTTYYISLQVQGDVEMSRQQITMSAYSASSDTANYSKAALSNWIVSNNVIYTNGAWGIARGMANNSLFGTNANTHVNLGDYSTTGTNAQNYSYCTIGGGHLNTASANYSTVSCGYMNTANGNFSTISGGSTNTASGYSAFVGSGFQNTANGDYSMMGGGINNITSGITSVIAGGNTNKSMSTSTSVGGGQYNTAVTGQSTIGGGQYN